MSYAWGYGIGHLPMRAMRLVEDLGAAVTNYVDKGEKCHWFVMDPGERSTLELLRHAAHVQTACAQWLTGERQERGDSINPDPDLSGTVGVPVMICQTHDKALTCPSCKAAAAGKIGGKSLSKRKLAQLKKASKKKRPGRTRNAEAKRRELEHGRGEGKEEEEGRGAVSANARGV